EISAGDLLNQPSLRLGQTTLGGDTVPNNYDRLRWFLPPCSPRRSTFLSPTPPTPLAGALGSFPACFRTAEFRRSSTRSVIPSSDTRRAPALIIRLPRELTGR